MSHLVVLYTFFFMCFILYIHFAPINLEKTTVPPSIVPFPTPTSVSDFVYIA